MLLVRRLLLLLPLAGSCADAAPAPAPGVDAGRCDPPTACRSCTPGALDCGADGLSPRRCTDIGTWVPLTACDGPRGQVCDRGRCADGCAEAAARREARGCSFWSTQTLHRAPGRLPSDERNHVPFTLVAANSWPSPVELTVEGGALSRPVRRTLPPQAVVQIELPWQPELVDAGDPQQPASGIVRGGALHLSSSAPVTAYQFSSLRAAPGDGCAAGDACDSHTDDASLLLPEHALGLTYVVATVGTARVLPPDRTEWAASPGFVAVVGTQPRTDVTVRLAGNVMASRLGEPIANSAAGSTARFTLGAGDVLQLLSRWDARCAHDVEDRLTQTRFCLPVAAEDLTGTTLSASAPVAVFAGHDCALVPFDQPAGAHIEEQVPAAETLGLRYVVARAHRAATPPDPAQSEGAPVVVRMVAVVDGTRLRFEPSGTHDPVTLTRGEFVSFTAQRSFSVEGSQPFLAASFLVGSGVFPGDAAAKRGAYGGPALAFETPVEQFREEYDLFAAPGFGPTFLDVFAPRDARLLLDGAPLTAASTPVGVHDFYELSLTGGLHRIESEGRQALLGTRLYGYAPFASYMVSGGGDLRAISVPP